jgi:hypothetical protein
MLVAQQALYGGSSCTSLGSARLVSLALAQELSPYQPALMLLVLLPCRAPWFCAVFRLWAVCQLHRCPRGSQGGVQSYG